MSGLQKSYANHSSHGSGSSKRYLLAGRLRTVEPRLGSPEGILLDVCVRGRAANSNSVTLHAQERVLAFEVVLRRP